MTKIDEVRELDLSEIALVSGGIVTTPPGYKPVPGQPGLYKGPNGVPVYLLDA